MAELRHRLHMQEVEKKVKLLRMNRFLKNYEQENENPDKPKPAATTSALTRRLVLEIQDMRDEIKDINTKLEKYQKKINAKLSNDPSLPVHFEQTEISYMFPIPPDVGQQLFIGMYLHTSIPISVPSSIMIS